MDKFVQGEEKYFLKCLEARQSGNQASQERS